MSFPAICHQSICEHNVGVRYFAPSAYNYYSFFMQYLRNKRKRRACWKIPWILRRKELGAHHALMRELSKEDYESYRNFVGMTREDFIELLKKVSPVIAKRHYYEEINSGC